MVKSVGSRFPPHTTGSCKMRNFANKGMLFPVSHLLVFTDNSVKDGLYDIHAIDCKVSMTPKIVKLNYFSLTRPSNNIN